MIFKDSCTAPRADAAQWSVGLGVKWGTQGTAGAQAVGVRRALTELPGTEVHTVLLPAPEARGKVPGA